MTKVMHSKRISIISLKIIPLLTLIFFNSLYCSHLSVREEKDSLGRVVSSTAYVKDSPETVVITKYIGETEKPLSKKFIKLKNETLIHSWLETYSYKKGRLGLTRFFVDIGNNRVPVGRIVYKYKQDNIYKIEYYFLEETGDRKLFRHGIDLYYYSGKKLARRRIIEYEKKPESGVSIQLSQYLINYNGRDIVSMQTKILDKKSNSIIINEETDPEIISVMINNIEKSLRERCKGYHLKY
ncbi:MAG: hypothetical protein JW864_10940 [Spirochaetes bacterium]|nr:hypothetical protein [Spirochaetota bacterium]